MKTKELLEDNEMWEVLQRWKDLDAGGVKANSETAWHHMGAVTEET